MTTALGPIGSEQLALRKVQNQTHATVATVPFNSEKKSIPAGISTVSSIAQSTAPAQKIILRPQLEIPAIEADLEDLPKIKESYLWVLLNLHNMFEGLSERHIKFISDTIRHDTAILKKLNTVKTEELRKYALELEGQKTWNVFSEVLKTFLNTATLVIGGLMVASGVASVAGAFMIASGGLGLTDTILTHTGAYEAIAAHFTKSREMQQNIAAYISGTVLFLSIGCGLIGGVMGYLSNGLEAASAGMDLVKAGEKISLTAAIATGALNVARDWSGKETAAVRQVLQFVEGQIEILKLDLQLHATEAKDTLSIMQTITKQAHETMTAATAG